MHTAASAFAKLQQQQYSQQLRAASEIAQRSFEPLPILSFVKAHPPTHPIIMVLAIFQRTIEQNDSAASVRIYSELHSDSNSNDQLCNFR